MQTAHVRIHSFVSLLILIGMVGCGAPAEGPQTVPVTGEVTLDGQTLTGADLAFVPVAGSPDAAPAQAVTDAAGRFEVISVFDQGKTTKPGMIPGDYRVEVRLLQAAPAGTISMEAPTNVLPEKYASATTSGLQVTVASEGKNHFPLKITK